MSTSCPNCSAEAAPPRCSSCHWAVFEPKAGPMIVVAHESAEVAEEIGDVLTRAGFWALAVGTGRRALGLLESGAAFVLDVGLASDMMAFQVIDQIRAAPGGRELPVLLVASVYNKAAYKRRPSELYGADDYVEQHHITDMLPSKLCSLLGIDPSGVAELMSSSEAAAVNERLAAMDATVVDAAHTIVADIALYHQSDFEQAVAGQETATLKTALEEGTRMLAERTGIEEAAAKGPLRSAFRAFVSDLRKDQR